jgi:NitT/TauT family transport system substrate-binding protein
MLAVLVGVASAGSVRAADLDYGKVGTPINLVVGYQPYYTESWSGVVMRGKELWKKYLPAGSTVEFQVGLQGAIIVNAMLAGKQHIGYMGDMPAIVSTTKQDVADIRLVAMLGLAHDQCDVLLVRNDAPQFKNPKEAIAWLKDKQVAVPKGSCADRFGQAVFKQEKVEPAAYLNQNIEVITSGFRAGKIDAAVIWEPTASRLVEEGLARRVASGTSVNESDAAMLGMRYDLIKQRPDVVKAWLQAELEAQLYAADPKNATEVAKMAVAQTTGFTDKVMDVAVRRIPGVAGRRLRAHFLSLCFHATLCRSHQSGGQVPLFDQEYQCRTASARSGDARVCSGGSQGAQPQASDCRDQGHAGVAVQVKRLATFRDVRAG